MGRERLEIDVAEVVRLASRRLTEQQIADALGISLTTLERRKREQGVRGGGRRSASRRWRTRTSRQRWAAM